MEKLPISCVGKNCRAFVAVLGFSLLSVFGHAQSSKAVKDSLITYFGKESCFRDAIAMKAADKPQNVYNALAYARKHDLSKDKAKDYLIGKFLTKSDIAHLTGCTTDELFGLDTSLIERPIIADNSDIPDEEKVTEEAPIEETIVKETPVKKETSNGKKSPVKKEKTTPSTSSDTEDFEKMIARLYKQWKKDHVQNSVSKNPSSSVEKGKCCIPEPVYEELINGKKPKK